MSDLFSFSFLFSLSRRHKGTGISQFMPEASNFYLLRIIFCVILHSSIFFPFISCTIFLTFMFLHIQNPNEILDLFWRFWNFIGWIKWRVSLVFKVISMVHTFIFDIWFCLSTFFWVLLLILDSLLCLVISWVDKIL